MTSERQGDVPIEQVLTGMRLHKLPDKWSPIEAFVLVKCINDEGNASWVYRTTSDPNREELLGVLVVHTELLRREIVSEWEDEDDEDE
jgi:hypothetical protein